RQEIISCARASTHSRAVCRRDSSGRIGPRFSTSRTSSRCVRGATAVSSPSSIAVRRWKSVAAALRLSARHSSPGREQRWSEFCGRERRYHPQNEERVAKKARKTPTDAPAAAESDSITREQLIDALNDDLSREYQAIIAYVVYSQAIKGAA